MSYVTRATAKATMVPQIASYDIEMSNWYHVCTGACIQQLIVCNSDWALCCTGVAGVAEHRCRIATAPVHHV
jgi:hypothetical protein